MSRKYSLQIQLIFAILLLLILSNVFFACVVFIASNRFEEQMLETQITNEVNEYIHRLAVDGSTPFPQSAKLSFYLQSSADIRPIPASFAALPPGLYHAVEWQGRPYQLAIRDMDADRIYMALDISDFEQQEHKFRLALIAGTMLMPPLAILFGFWLLRKIVNPVGRLADEVARLEPKQRRRRLSSEFRGYEVERIAQAFDRYLENMDDFVEREQSFSAAASHELKTPLSVIATSAELIAADERLPEALRVPLGRIQRATQSMSALITALLFLSREHPPSQDIETETPVCEVLERLIDIHKGLMHTDQTTLSLYCREPTVVPAPADHISIVVNNLLQNAVFYTKAGLIAVNLENGCVTVSDTGSGIAPEDMDKIFSREFSGKSSKGQGLGLYIAKRICDHYGWQLTLNSTPGRGTRATLDFKLATPDRA